MFEQATAFCYCLHNCFAVSLSFCTEKHVTSETLSFSSRVRKQRRTYLNPAFQVQLLLTLLQPHKPFPCCHVGICIQDYSVWSAWRQTCLLCCHAKMKGWTPFCCQTVLWYFYYPRVLFFPIWLRQGIKLWTFIAPTFAFFSHVERKQQSDAVLARKWGQAFLDLPMFIMKRLCECITKLSFPLTQPYWPSGTIHASEETGDDISEKTEMTQLVTPCLNISHFLLW